MLAITIIVLIVFSNKEIVLIAKEIKFIEQYMYCIVPGTIYILTVWYSELFCKLYNWITDYQNVKTSPITSYLISLEQKYCESKSEKLRFLLLHLLVFSEINIISLIYISGYTPYAIMILILITIPFIIRAMLRKKRRNI